MFNVYSVRTGGRGDVGARYLSFADFCSKRWGQNYSRSFAPSLSPSLENKVTKLHFVKSSYVQLHPNASASCL